MKLNYNYSKGGWQVVKTSKPFVGYFIFDGNCYFNAVTRSFEYGLSNATWSATEEQARQLAALYRMNLVN